MRTRVLLLAVLVLVCWAAGASAGKITLQDQGRGAAGAPHLDLRDITIWCQPPELVNWAKLSSQIDTEYPFDSGAADDYMSSSDYAATFLEWWGGQWNYTGYPGSLPTCGPDYFVITFYAYDGTCFPPLPEPVAPDFLPNNYIHQEILYSWNETVLDPVYHLVEYSAPIGPVLQDAGAMYWIEIQAGLFFGSCGQWGWLNSSSAYNCNPARGFPLLGNNYWYTDLDYPAMAFCLYSDQSVPASPSTWGNIKAIYR
jgi:hypothetical protein